ncbi:MAG TPA: ABC transporter substrate-binding protein [Anaeromyxobacteraceae bacterium]|nr:ABC transporter substrate-binding protein [Anaeromyxobacteraceae bacterium]
MKALLLLALIAMLMPAAATAGVRPRYGGELRVLLPSPPLEFDPARMNSFADLAAARATQATLLEHDSRGALRPGLLETLPAPEDGGRSYRLRLAPGLRFQDGEPIAASDVAASLARLAGPPSIHAWLTSSIAGAHAVKHGHARLIAGIEVLSERELRITLSYPFLDFPQALAALPSAIVRVDKGGNLVGAGAFRPGGERRFQAFDDCEGGRPFADSLALAGADARAAAPALADHRADIAIRPELVEGGSHLETAPLGLVMAIVSQRLGPTARGTWVALDAVDRRELTRFVRAPAAPLNSLLPASREKGAPRGAVPMPLPRKITLSFPDNSDALRAAAARIQVSLYDRGVKVALETTPARLFAARLASGDFDVALLPVWLVSPVPALALAQIAAATGGFERAARVLAQAAGADAVALSRLSSSLETDLLAVPLFSTGLRVAAREGVEGLWLHEDGTPELGDAWLWPEGSRGP